MTMTPTPADIREYDSAAPSREETETATFALGCFWGPDAQFGAIDGVVRTRAGYAGGTKPDPTYHALGNHTEVFQVDYDPATLDYTDLLERVFQGHDPHQQTRKTQYQNIVFAGTSEQQATLASYLDANGYDADAIETRIEQLSRFYLAEDYHQKHDLRARESLLNIFKEAGYDDEQLRESPAAATLNGFAAGHDVSAELGLETAENRTVHGG